MSWKLNKEYDAENIRKRYGLNVNDSYVVTAERLVGHTKDGLGFFSTGDVLTITEMNYDNNAFFVSVRCVETSCAEDDCLITYGPCVDVDVTEFCTNTEKRENIYNELDNIQTEYKKHNKYIRYKAIMLSTITVMITLIVLCALMFSELSILIYIALSVIALGLMFTITDKIDNWSTNAKFDIKYDTYMPKITEILKSTANCKG